MVRGRLLGAFFFFFLLFVRPPAALQRERLDGREHRCRDENQCSAPHGVAVLCVFALRLSIVAPPDVPSSPAIASMSSDQSGARF